MTLIFRLTWPEEIFYLENFDAIDGDGKASPLWEWAVLQKVLRIRHQAVDEGEQWVHHVVLLSSRVLQQHRLLQQPTAMF